MQNESQKHDLNSYPFLRHRESFMLFLLSSKYRSNSVITLRFTMINIFNKGKYRIQIKANWKTLGKKLNCTTNRKITAQKYKKTILTRLNAATANITTDFHGWKRIFLHLVKNNGPNPVTKVDNSDCVRRRWELIITGKVRIIFEKIGTRLKWMW